MALATPVNIPDAAFYTYLHDILVEKGIITSGTLDLNNNQINDLSNVSNLPSSLTSILLNTNQIATLPPQDSFSHLTNLESLQLGDNQISDISSLAGLPNSISQLLLFNNQITDLSALAGLTSLTELQLYMNTDLTDITPLYF